MVGQAYKDIGVASVAMGGGDILPALEKGTIDAAEWCCPKPDMVFGFQKVLKHYYLQGLHQVVVNADMYVNGDFYDGLVSHRERKPWKSRLTLPCLSLCPIAFTRMAKRCNLWLKIMA